MLETNIKIEVNQSKVLKNGLKIKFLKFGSESESHSTDEISTPSGFLSIYHLELTLGKVIEKATISYSYGGFLTNATIEFEGFKISYSGVTDIKDTTTLSLSISPISK